MPDASQSNVTNSPSARLRRMIAEWRGAERGEPVTSLFNDCRAAAGDLDVKLLPVAIDVAPGLATSTLEEHLRARRTKNRLPVEVRFRTPRTGTFDTALIPARRNGAPADSWLLVMRDTLAPADQHALFAHAVGHLLLDFELTQLDQPPILAPSDGYAHADVLAELRSIEGFRRSEPDRRVVDAFPEFADLLYRAQLSTVVTTTEAAALRRRLLDAGWADRLVKAPFIYAEGRVYSEGRRGRRSQVDALLRADTSLPIAIVRLARPNEAAEIAERQALAQAERLHVPFAYVFDAEGTVREIDRAIENEPAVNSVPTIPRPDELLGRWLTPLGFADERARETLRYPYEMTRRVPRYYQEAAVNRAVVGVLQAQRGLRPRRLMLNLATGTGKTQVAFQIVWKLKRTRAVARTLYLTDRDFLVSEPMDNDFAPFANARGRIMGGIDTAREVLFATYQAIGDSEGRPGLFRDYQPNFFDLIVVDECHRGSASEDSVWRDVLTYFDSAVQIGMTATPKQTGERDNYDYFGQPLVAYSLRDGINDGFLAPYQVRRVVLGEEAQGGDNAETAEALDEDAAARIEPAERLRQATAVIAKHLANYLLASDPTAQTIVFCVDQPHADAMRVSLDDELRELAPTRPVFVARITSAEGQEGKYTLARFCRAASDAPVVVTTSRLLTTGVDIPRCKNIALARPVNSVAEFKQIIGRGTRLHLPDKASFTILDYAGATRHFFDPDFDGDPESVIVERLARVAAPEPQQESAAAVPAAAEPVSPPAATVEAPVIGAISTKAVPEEERFGTDIAPPVEPSSEPPVVTSADERTPIKTLGTEPSPKSEPPVESPHTSAAAVNHAPNRAVFIPPPPTVVRQSDGATLKIVGEIVFELDPDGATLREVAYDAYAREVVLRLVESANELREAWLEPDRRAAILEGVREEGIDLGQLVEVLGIDGCDDYDVIRSAAFGIETRTRLERAESARSRGAIFLERFDVPARRVLEVILDKYVAGEAPDPGDPELLSVPPLSDEGSPLELAKRFGVGAAMRSALSDLRTLVYTDDPTPSAEG